MFGEDRWLVALFIFAAVTVGMIAQGWASLLEHQRRRQAMDIIKAAIEAGKEPPQIVYDQLSKADAPKQPWTEVVLFGALGAGFWIAYANAEADSRTAFLVVASTMTFTAIGCLVLALTRGGKDDERR